MNSEGRKQSLAESQYSDNCRSAAILTEYTPQVLQEILEPVQAMRQNAGGSNAPVICDPFCKHCDTDACPHGKNRAPKDQGFCDRFEHAAKNGQEVFTMIEQAFQGMLVDVN